MLRHALTLLPFSLACACGDDRPASPDSHDATDATEVAETIVDGEVTDTLDTLIRPEAETAEVVEPLETPTGVWTWFDQPGSACSDGSATGFAVNAGTSDDVLVLFMGGGACWDFNTCFLFSAAATGPFQKGQWDALAPSVAVGVLDRADAENPYRTWTQVFIPYCTGDLHAGDNVASYTAGGITRTWSHTGGRNARLLLPRIAAAFHAPDHLVVAGLSAGGYGATLQYRPFREAFAAATTQLVDDSGPFLVGNALSADFRSAWFVHWRLDQLVDPVCGQDCKLDLSLLYPKLAALYPDDRMALISSLQDEVIAGYHLMEQAQFEVEIDKLAQQVLAPLADFRTFLIAGATHTTLADPKSFTTQGIDLRTWLTQMVSDDPAWSNVAP